MASKTGMDSLPDEILHNIVLQVAGELEYDEYFRSYTRSLLDNTSLRNLRLVNKRFSRIASLELYRIPSLMSSLQWQERELCLTSDHVHILLHSGIEQAARCLSLAGSSAFFAGILETHFLKLTSLTLVFSKSLGAHGGNESGIRESRSLSVLRNALRSTPLRQLYIHFGADLSSSKYEYFQIVSLAAGHATLQHLSIDIMPRVQEKDFPVPTTHNSTSIRSLDIGYCWKEPFQVIQSALGSLPNLSNLSVDLRLDASKNDIGILNAFNAASKHNISWLRIRMSDLHHGLWQALATFPNLRSLYLELATEETSEELGDWILPSLEEILIDCRFTLSIGSIVMEQAAYRDLLPSLRRIVFLVSDDAYRGAEAEENAEIFVEAYDELVVSTTGIDIRPRDIRELVYQRLENMRNSSRGLQAKDT